MPTIQSRAFNYPRDFVARAKEAFPDADGLHVLLDTNSVSVGDFLERALSCITDPADERLPVLRKLYSDWRELRHPSCSVR